MMGAMTLLIEELKGPIYTTNWFVIIQPFISKMMMLILFFDRQIRGTLLQGY